MKIKKKTAISYRMSSIKTIIDKYQHLLKCFGRFQKRT